VHHAFKNSANGNIEETIHPRGINIHSHLEQKYLDKVLKKISTVFRNEPGKIKLKLLRNYVVIFHIYVYHLDLYKWSRISKGHGQSAGTLNT